MKLPGKTLYVTDRKVWRSWLSKNHKKEPEIWLIYYRKDSGKPCIPYDDAVLEALCYGWIDSTVKKIDEERFTQRFCPRRPKSKLSQTNLERVRELVKHKKMTKAGLRAIEHVFDPENDDPEEFTIPPDILNAIKTNKDAWKHFQMMPGSYKRIRIAYIESRKRHSEELYEKALAHFIKRTSLNKRIGYVQERKNVKK